jgi:hypothetical protein
MTEPGRLFKGGINKDTPQPREEPLSREFAGARTAEDVMGLTSISGFSCWSFVWALLNLIVE